MKLNFTLSSIAKTVMISAGLIASASVWSQPVARWTFEAVTFNAAPSQTPVLTAGTFAADEGTQPAGSAFTAFHTSTATVYSTPAGNGSAKSISSNNWAVGDYYQFQVNTTGVTGVAIVFDLTSSNTGPAEFKVQHSIDNITYTDFANYTVPNNAGVAISWSATTPNANSSLSFNLSAITALNNKPIVYFRLVKRSTVAINGTTVATTGTSRIDNFAVWQNSVLPLSLTGFNAFLVNGKASLTWTSINEVNVKGFSIEKSLNGTNFSEISFVNATNRPSNTYTISDDNVKPGINYYRLKMMDADGASRYSSVVVLSVRNYIKTSVFPNPAVNNITVAHDRAEKGAVIRILTMEGRQVKMTQIQAGAQQTGITVNELISGNYMLIYESNGEKVTSKFSKQ